MSRSSFLVFGAAAVALATTLAAIPAGAQTTGPVGQNGWTVQLFATNVQPVTEAGPASLAFDSSDNLYLAPNGFAPNGGGALKLLIIPAGTTTPVQFGPAIEDADGVAIDSMNNINVGGDPVTQLNPATGAVQWQRTCPDGNPNRAAVDELGNVYVGTIPVAGVGGTHVCKFSSDGQTLQLLGTGLTWPSNVGAGPDGFLYVAEVPPPSVGTPRLLRLDRNSGAVRAVIDVGTAYGQPDFDDHDNIYLPAAFDREVVRINLVSGQQTVLASGFDFPNAVAFDSHGVLYVADAGSKNVYTLTRPTIGVTIDVLPRCVVSNGASLIPVVIYSTPGFDATRIDPASLTLDGQPVKALGNGTLLAFPVNFNGGPLDLLVFFDSVAGTYAPPVATATLTGVTVDWDPIEGQEQICVT